MAERVITAHVFYDIFMLCHAWQSKGSEPQHAYTTVDKVVRILCGLSILTEKQRKTLFRDSKLQSLFLKSATLYESGTGFFRPTEQFMDNVRLNICLPGSSERREQLNRERMLRDYRIYITARGIKYGLGGEAQYADVITREGYFAEIERQGPLKEGAQAPIIKKYKDRVLEETS